MLLYSMDIGNGVAKMSMVEQLNFSTVVVSSSLRYQQIEKDINAFVLTSAAELMASTGDLKRDVAQMIPTKVEQGFVDDRNLRKIQRGKTYKKLDFVQLDAATREMVRQEGWAAWEKIGYDRSTDVFAAVADPDCLVRIESSSHMLFDRHGDPLPVGINFDYISHGGVTDGRYDLKKLAAYLLTRDDVWIFPKKGGWRRAFQSQIGYQNFVNTGTATNVNQDECDRSKRATKVEECITDIPSYNSERGASQTIYFRWAPTVGDYRKMWAHCTANYPRYPSTCMHHAIFELDLIGARAAGCALFDEYHKSTRYESSNESDDDAEDQEDY